MRIYMTENNDIITETELTAEYAADRIAVPLTQWITHLLNSGKIRKVV